MNELDLLAVGAHPDDVEVHVGGLLALAAVRGLKAGILDLTSGDLGTRGTADTRRAEATEAARILAIAERPRRFGSGEHGAGPAAPVQQQGGMLLRGPGRRQRLGMA